MHWAHIFKRCNFVSRNILLWGRIQIETVNFYEQFKHNFVHRVGKAECLDKWNVKYGGHWRQPGRHVNIGSSQFQVSTLYFMLRKALKCVVWLLRNVEIVISVIIFTKHNLRLDFHRQHTGVRLCWYSLIYDFGFSYVVVLIFFSGWGSRNCVKNIQNGALLCSGLLAPEWSGFLPNVSISEIAE